MRWTDALRDIELSEKEMEGRVCSCPETGQPDEFGDGSSLPCMSMEIDNNLSCNKCIYCIKKNEKIQTYT